MRVEIVMPQMGESIVEGTIVEWLKNVGDSVEVDEDIFTLSTDKVDAEVPSTHAGVLVEQLAQVGDVIEVGKPVAVIETDAASASAGSAAEAPAAPAPAPAAAEASTPAAPEPAAAPAPAAKPAPAAASAGGAAMTDAPEPLEPVAELRRRRSTPLVRKMAAEHGISDLSMVPGTGVSGRVTKKDLLAFIKGLGRGNRHPTQRQDGKEDCRAHRPPRFLNNSSAAQVRLSSNCKFTGFGGGVPNRGRERFGCSCNRGCRPVGQ